MGRPASRADQSARLHTKSHPAPAVCQHRLAPGTAVEDGRVSQLLKQLHLEPHYAQTGPYRLFAGLSRTQFSQDLQGQIEQPWVRVILLGPVVE